MFINEPTILVVKSPDWLFDKTLLKLFIKFELNPLLLKELLNKLKLLLPNKLFIEK